MLALLNRPKHINHHRPILQKMSGVHKGGVAAVPPGPQAKSETTPAGMPSMESKGRRRWSGKSLQPAAHHFTQGCCDNPHGAHTGAGTGWRGSRGGTGCRWRSGSRTGSFLDSFAGRRATAGRPKGWPQALVWVDPPPTHHSTCTRRIPLAPKEKTLT